MNIGFSVDLKNDMSKMVKEEAEKATLKILRLWGSKAVENSVDAISGNAGIDSAVDTGRLRASLSYILPDGTGGDSGMLTLNQQLGDKLSGKADENSVIVGTNVEYAIYVHEGTEKMPARPFLRLAIDNMKDDAKEMAERVLKGDI